MVVRMSHNVRVRAAQGRLFYDTVGGSIPYRSLVREAQSSPRFHTGAQ
jgi:hypothetical protein